MIDFGSGCGSSALAFSYYARAVEGFEIDQPSVDAFRARMDVFGVANAKVQLAGPEEILEGALAAVEPGTTFVFLAVVEHLLEEERISYLRAAWNALHPGDLLVIAETPNYYAYFDGHTFGVPFASMVPDPYFERWLVQQGDGLRFGVGCLADGIVDSADGHCPGGRIGEGVACGSRCEFDAKR